MEKCFKYFVWFCEGVSVKILFIQNNLLSLHYQFKAFKIVTTSNSFFSDNIFLDTFISNIKIWFSFCSTAPSEVLAIRQENTSQNSVILLWHEPNQPNGVILEYDVKYYEKVRTLHTTHHDSYKIHI